LGGLLAQAAAYYVEANAAFRKLDGYRDELASLLNNLAYVYARQGHKNRALLLAHEALRINEETGNEYSTGLTLSALARIQRMWGNYPQAMAYGEEALDLFRELEDAHGTDLAYLHAAAAKRRLAKDNIERGWKLETAFQELEEARQFLDNALKVAREAGLEPDMPDLYAEQGRLYRLLGHIAYQLEGDARKGVTYFRQSKEYLERAFQTEASKVNKADIRQDLAEGCFLSGDDSAAQEQLQAAEDLIGPEHRIVPGQPAPKEELPNEYFRPLGKIERLRGDMAFAQEQFEAGLQHYTLAYAYFMRFSPEAVEKDKILESLYRHLRDLPVEHQQSLVEMVRRSIQQYDIGLGLDLLAGTLTDLLGV
jgi:tetratricopeptide (TPR) repeat protein